jgi:hypothetical protein
MCVYLAAAVCCILQIFDWICLFVTLITFVVILFVCVLHQARWRLYGPYTRIPPCGP